MDKYYDATAKGYDELHGKEQEHKLSIIKKNLSITKKTKLLDVGCGTGLSSDFDCKVTGIDPSSGLLEYARKKFPNFEFIQAPAEKLPFENHVFDVVVSVTAIQNFDDIEQGLREIKRVGTNQFALSYLKKSPKAKEIENAINSTFSDYVRLRIEEDKDIIFIIT